MSSAASMLEALEAAYRPELPLEAWTTSMRARALRLVPEAEDAHALVYHRSKHALEPLPGTTATPALDAVLETNRHLDADTRRRIYDVGPMAQTASELFARQQPGALASSPGFQDVLGLFAPMADQTGFSLAITLGRPVQLKPTPRERLVLFVRHLAMAHQARNLWAQQGPSLEMTPGGRCLHAEGEARDPEVRARLLRAWKALESGRVRSRREDGQAVDLWRRLLDGGWTVVEDVDTGGRRRIVAVRVPSAEAVASRRLTEGERRIIDLVVAGVSNKVIAIELGLPESTVATRLTRAMHKLGVPSRVELVRLARALQPVS